LKKKNLSILKFWKADPRYYYIFTLILIMHVCFNFPFRIRIEFSFPIRNCFPFPIRICFLFSIRFVFIFFVNLGDA
jgi:hypothetical protein